MSKRIQQFITDFYYKDLIWFRDDHIFQKKICN